MHFGENQLSPRSFGISPLPTAPPTALQRGTVRASTPRYGRFALAMGSSRGFGPAPRHKGALFRLAFAAPPRLRRFGNRDAEQLAGSFFNRHAIRPPRGVATPRLCPLTGRRRAVSGSVSLPARGFFSPFPHGTVRYRSPRPFSLGAWAPRLPAGFLVPGGTHAPPPRPAPPPTGLSPSAAAPPRVLRPGAGLLTRPGGGRPPRVVVQPPAPIGRPATQGAGFGLVPVRSPLLRESRLISREGVLRCFRSPPRP